MSEVPLQARRWWCAEPSTVSSTYMKRACFRFSRELNRIVSRDAKGSDDVGLIQSTKSPKLVHGKKEGSSKRTEARAPFRGIAREGTLGADVSS